MTFGLGGQGALLIPMPLTALQPLREASRVYSQSCRTGISGKSAAGMG